MEKPDGNRPFRIKYGEALIRPRGGWMTVDDALRAEQRSESGQGITRQRREVTTRRAARSQDKVARK